MIINTVKTLALLVFFSCFIAILHASDKDLSETQAPDKPELKENTTTGFIQELTETRIHKGPDRSGKEVYEFRCKGCHAKNTQGAPMPGDQFDWGMRVKKKGLKLMLKHSMEGFNNNLMPPKGGCRNCNKKEVYAAVFYMLDQSGIEVKVKRKAPDTVKKHKD